MTHAVRIEKKGTIIIATIDRPHKLNAADLHVYHELERALEMDARGYVFTGAGGHFSAGDDIAMFSFDDDRGADAFIVEVQRLFQTIEAVPRPVVAAVDGYALAFGFELALACDVIIATPEALFGLPEITHALAPPNAIGRGVDVIGRGMIRHLALMGRRWISGREAHNLGMVAEIHSSEKIVEAAVDLAAEMAGQPDFVQAKRLLNLQGDPAMRLAAMVIPRLMSSPQVAASHRRYSGHG
jgi:enoyl-CoA hydratase